MVRQVKCVDREVNHMTPEAQSGFQQSLLQRPATAGHWQTAKQATAEEETHDPNWSAHMHLTLAGCLVTWGETPR